MNDSLGPEDIVPSALVFGEFPSLRTFQGPVIPHSTLAERAEVALKARRYISRHFADNKIQRDLQHNTLPAADRDYSPGDKVLIWWEKQVENRIGEWIGPYTVVSYDAEARIVLVQLSADAQYERCYTVQSKPFEARSETAARFMCILHSAVRPVASEHPATIHITEVIGKHEPRASAPEMLLAIGEEARELLKRGTFIVFKKKELPNGLMCLQLVSSSQLSQKQMEKLNTKRATSLAEK